MKILDYFKPQTEKNVICLGRFDGLHLGHKTLIYKGLEIKNQLNDDSKLAVFIFQRNAAIGRLNAIFTFRETIETLKGEPVDSVIVAPESREFYKIDKLDFVDTIFKNFNPTAIVCGDDYTFGYNREGNKDFLKTYCEERGVTFICLPLVKIKGEKVSSTKIREFLSCGEVEEASKLLGENYFISGKVEKGRGVGKTLGFPTLNIEIPEEKAPLKKGVYVTLVDYGKYQLTSLTNYGNAPTFSSDKVLLETHILDGEYDLYDKEVKIEFIRYLREIKKFNDAQELKEQIEKDVQSI